MFKAGWWPEIFSWIVDAIVTIGLFGLSVLVLFFGAAVVLAVTDAVTSLKERLLRQKKRDRPSGDKRPQAPG